MKYEAIKNKLLHMQNDLGQRLDKTKKHITHADGPPNPDFEEQAVECANDDVIYKLNESAKSELAQIKKALEKIENNEYGVCSECGNPIPAERLEAVPFTNFCKDCADLEIDT